MRKPSVLSTSRIVQAALALLVVSACNSEKADVAVSATTPMSVGSGGVRGSIGGGAAASDGFSARDEAQSQKLVVTEQASAAPPVAPEPARNAAMARSDLPSLGMPMPAIDPAGAMLVRHGQASIEVKTLDEAVTRLRQTASQFGGFVANTTLRTGKDEQRSGMLQLRVPSAQFDGAVAALAQLGKVESVNVSAEDVGEEYVDLGARLTNARRVEARLVEMLATRTGKLSDVLTVEQELARVRMEAERYEARMRWLERRASLSSLDVTIHEKLPLLDSPRGRGPIVEAFAEAWERMVGVVAWFIASLGILVPLGVIVGLGVLAARRLLRGGTPPGVSQA
ncbi:MAG TPA: DUF4349 domain-containing protein [Gemmatimonadaceae bacterium]|nr:DUF4349 domain-containing protein [Gemmatimonadaceae bacterium]